MHPMFTALVHRDGRRRSAGRGGGRAAPAGPGAADRPRSSGHRSGTPSSLAPCQQARRAVFRAERRSAGRRCGDARPARPRRRVPCRCRSAGSPVAARDRNSGMARVISARDMVPGPLPRISNPKLRSTSTGNEMVGPAICPTSTSRTRGAAWARPRRVMAAMAASVGRPGYGRPRSPGRRPSARPAPPRFGRTRRWPPAPARFPRLQHGPPG
jgi:hypothetical protein